MLSRGIMRNIGKFAEGYMGYVLDASAKEAEIKREDDKIKFHIEPDSFKISGKVPIGKREIYVMIAIFAAALGVSYEEIFSYMGVM